MPGLKKQWAVLCKNLHYAGGPYATAERAWSVANYLNKKAEHEERTLGGKGCRFMVIDFYVAVMSDDEAREELDSRKEAPPKMRLN
jgi:hypothetical protein